MALTAQGQKSLFPCWPALHQLFCYHIPLQVASEDEQKSGKGLNGEELDSNLGCLEVYPGASPPCLGGRTGRDDSETPVSVRDRLTLAREGA